MTDDREQYARGNYYVTYQRAFARTASITLAHPLEPLPNPNNFDLVVLGHAAVENFARIRGARFIPMEVRNHLWFRHRSLLTLRYARTPLVLYSKNDYERFSLKNSFIAFVRPDVVVTHTRSALVRLQQLSGLLKWQPFGIDTRMFSPPTAEFVRPFVLGFRANTNFEYNGGERDRFFDALTRLKHMHPVSLTMSRRGEGFLVGDQYVEWLRSCLLLGNTVSAAGTVGPRYLEAMACGTVPLAPRNEYEGLLLPNIHYVPVNEGADGKFSNLESELDRFLHDRVYREGIQHECARLVQSNDVDSQVTQVFNAVGV